MVLSGVVLSRNQWYAITLCNSQVEQEVMPLDAVGKTTTIDDSTAQALLLGMFMSRSLITTVRQRNISLYMHCVIYIVLYTSCQSNTLCYISSMYEMNTDS